MKRNLFFSILFSTMYLCQAWAAEPQPAKKTAPAGRPTDLMYIPMPSEFLVVLSYRKGQSQSSFKSGAAVYSESKIDWTDTDLTLRYGIFKDSSVLLNGNIQGSSTSESTFGPGAPSFNGTKKSYTSSGSSEPALAIDRRFMHQRDYGVDFNASVRYSPKMGNAKSSTSTVQGNRLRGGDSTEVTVLLGRKEKNFSWATGLGYSFFGEQTTEGVAEKRSTQGANALLINGQVPLGEIYSFDAFLIYLKSETPKTSTVSAYTTVATSLNLGLNAQINYMTSLSLQYVIQRLAMTDIEAAGLRLATDNYSGSSLSLLATIRF
jgi:hypothetical protein